MGGDALLHSGAPQMTLAWMADEQSLGWQGVNFSTPLPAGVKLVYPPPSLPTARQAAIVKTQWDTGVGGLVLHVDINAFTPDADTRQLTVTEDGLVIAKQTITLAAHHPNHIDVPLPGVKSDRAIAVKVAMDADDLPIDDTFYAVHEPDASRQIYLTPLAGEETILISCATPSTRPRPWWMRRWRRRICPTPTGRRRGWSSCVAASRSSSRRSPASMRS